MRDLLSRFYFSAAEAVAKIYEVNVSTSVDQMIPISPGDIRLNFNRT